MNQGGNHWDGSHGFLLFYFGIDIDEKTYPGIDILCEQIKTVDINVRKYKKVEKIPEDILNEIIDIVFSEIENSGI